MYQSELSRNRIDSEAVIQNQLQLCTIVTLKLEAVGLWNTVRMDKVCSDCDLVSLKKALLLFHLQGPQVPRDAPEATVCCIALWI